MTNPYDEILRQAEGLNREELLRLCEELSMRAARKNGRYSIMELKGLGKETWTGIDVERYVDEERNSWNG